MTITNTNITKTIDDKDFIIQRLEKENSNLKLYITQLEKHVNVLQSLNNIYRKKLGKKS